MSLPDKWNNLVGNRVLPYTDIAITQTLASAATSTGTAFSTDYGATIVVLSQLASGSGYLTGDVATTAAAINLNTPTSGGFTLTLSGTSLQATYANTSNAKPYFQMAAVCVSNMGFRRLVILVCYELSYGQDWFSVQNGSYNAVGSTINNDSSGTGNMNFDIF